MASWQFAWLTDQPYTTIGFSHPQPGLAADLGALLGAGAVSEQSTEWQISLDRARVNLGYVSGLLGDRGWEMLAVESRPAPQGMTAGQVQTNWYYRKPGPDRTAAELREQVEAAKKAAADTAEAASKAQAEAAKAQAEAAAKAQAAAAAAAAAAPYSGQAQQSPAAPQQYPQQQSAQMAPPYPPQQPGMQQPGMQQPGYPSQQPGQAGQPGQQGQPGQPGQPGQQGQPGQPIMPPPPLPPGAEHKG